MYGPWELDDVRKVASELSGRLLPDVRYYAISTHPFATIFLAVNIWQSWVANDGNLIYIPMCEDCAGHVAIGVSCIGESSC